ncbi:MAG: DUF6288 domain-containing protein, partial [Planctomycetota bacterium]
MSDVPLAASDDLRMAAPTLLTLCTGLALAASMSSTSPVFAIQKHHPWEIQTAAGPDTTTGGWLINLGVTGIRAKLLPESPRELVVGYVFEETPAHGKLQIGDRITGVNGASFSSDHRFGSAVDVAGYDGPLMDFGIALEESQRKLGGRLVLEVNRAGETPSVVLNIGTTYGAYAPTFPFDCAKSDRVLRELRAYLAATQRDDGLWANAAHTNCFAALALLSSDLDKHRAAARRAAKAFAVATTSKVDYRGLNCWKYGLYGIYLAEYYLLTREPWVLRELEEINRWLHRAQLKSGGWGHRPGFGSFPSGAESFGYGGINIITLQAKIAWGLMTRCGLDVDPDKLRAAHEFVQRGTNRHGYVDYKDDQHDSSWLADMGRTGASAAAHRLCLGGDENYRRVTLLNARCIGHYPKTFPDTRGSPLLGMVWTALGTVAEPAMLRRLLDANRWHFALARCPDGTFYTQPNRDGSPHDFVTHSRLGASAVAALILSVRDRRLQLTGAELVSLPPARVDLVTAPETTSPTKSPSARSFEEGVTLPGIEIDVADRCVDGDAQVCIRQGTVELNASTKDSKEHESIVVVDARPMHIHTALLLLGATNGQPATRKKVGERNSRWVVLPPRGDSIETYLVFENAKGKRTEHPVSDFVRDARTGDRVSNEFLFTGSRLLKDERGTRRYLADLSGHVVSISPFGDEL